MHVSIPAALALGIFASPVLSGGGTVTSTEPGPPALSDATTGQMLGTMSIVPATARTSVAAVTYVAPPRKNAEDKTETAPTGPLDPRETISQCTTCHGVDGIARIPTAPNIAGSSRQYLESQLKAFRSGKRENEVMSVIAEELSNAEIKAVAKWYAGLKVTVEVPK